MGWIPPPPPRRRDLTPEERDREIAEAWLERKRASDKMKWWFWEAVAVGWIVFSAIGIWELVW